MRYRIWYLTVDWTDRNSPPHEGLVNVQQSKLVPCQVQCAAGPVGTTEYHWHHHQKSNHPSNHILPQIESACALPTVYLRAIPLKSSSVVSGKRNSRFALTLLPFIPNQNVFLLYGPHQSLVHASVMIRVKVWMMKHLLNEVFQLGLGSCIKLAMIL